MIHNGSGCPLRGGWARRSLACRPALLSSCDLVYRDRAMDFSDFDARNYKTVSVEDGYGEWAGTYEETVLDQLDRPLLSRIRSVEWAHVRRAADLACGTGRTAAWLSEQGVRRIDGVDLSPEMIKWARAKGLHAELRVGDVLATPLESAGDTLTAMIEQTRSKAIYTTRVHRLRPLSSHHLIVEYASSCGSGSWTYDPAISLELPRQVTLTETDWSVCFDRRGLSSTNLVIVLHHPDRGERELELFKGGVMRWRS